MARKLTENPLVYLHRPASSVPLDWHALEPAPPAPPRADEREPLPALWNVEPDERYPPTD